MLEAVKQTFAVKPRGATAPAYVRPAFRPVPVGAGRDLKRGYWKPIQTSAYPAEGLD